MENLNEYEVTLYDSSINDNFVFLCWAEDISHAIEQATNAYPNDDVVSVEEM